MNFIDFFTKNEFDNHPFLRKNGEDFTLFEIKKLVAFQTEFFRKKTEKNVILFSDSNFEFIINFFGAVFAKKEIYLLNDKTRLESLNIDFILPEIVSEPIENYKFLNINSNEIFVNFYTSGSSSKPKKIKKSLYNLITEGQDLYDQFCEKIPKSSVFVSTTNLTHLFGMTFHFMLPFNSKFLIDTEKIDYPEELDKKNNYIFISTPSFLDRIIDYKMKSIPSLIISAGAKLKNETFEYYEKNTSVLEIYGSTETGVIAFRTTSQNDILTLLNNVNLLENSENVTVQSEYFLEDLMTVSDAYEIVCGNSFVLKKRTDRIVKIMEKRISLEEIEDILNKHKFIKENYCFSHCEKLCSVIVLTEDGKEFFKNNDSIRLINEIKKFGKNYSEILPKKWRFLPQIPRTIHGKIDKEKIVKIFKMKLSFPLISELNISQNAAEIKMLFPENCNFFNGHFKNYPILPGVVQLFYANYFFEDIFNCKLPLSEVKKMKFSNIIHPNKEIILNLKNKNSSAEYAYLADDKIFSSGIFVK